MLYRISSETLWQQWQQRYQPRVVRTIPAVDPAYFYASTNPDDLDEARAEYEDWLKRGEKVWIVEDESQASREAMAICLYERALNYGTPESAAKRRMVLEQAGYRF